ncbi:MAG: hypothetical protein A2W72_03915 [Burkholderiales bacterium RIFCSPLOWO2_12_67_14]|nr:MAG: hypothetical protein A2W72_03915 [Burkholderiales bacterium RIFCSPLOWO2_12_67_14]OGB77471.1 MAG: hypothetical protein A3G82_10080 [Burkholderiales bacterium RIFCSPLOWO2_12_FULL_67_210]
MRNNSCTFSPNRQRGLTLIELLVALALGLLITLVALFALSMSSNGFRAVDSTSAMRDKERFAIELISRVVIQAGYEDWGNPDAPLRDNEKIRDPSSDPEPDVFGWNNATYATPSSRALSTIPEIVNGGRPTDCGSIKDTSCLNGSDILVVRYQGVSTPADVTKADNSVIDCAGAGVSASNTGSLDDRAFSIFHVSKPAVAGGEASLACSTYNPTTAKWVDSRPLIEGVESFQVLYGTDGVSPGVAPTSSQDTVAERWLRADELTVAGDAAATRENWRRVRSIRIGLTMRGPVGSAQETKTGVNLPLGALFESTNDVGSGLAVQADRRLRQTSTFTIHLRNDQTNTPITSP